MINNNPQDTSREQGMTDILKSWMMVVLTFIFVILYTAALLGWLKPLTDATMITRLEPIIFVIIGYYFGRLPAQQNEKTLKDEISRQTQKAEAAQFTKEQAQIERESLEEKIKNTKAILLASQSDEVSHKSSLNPGLDAPKQPELNSSSPDQLMITAAIGILDS